MPIRLIIADDHALLRSGLRALLERQEGLLVVGESEGADETLALLSHTPCDVLLLDMMMPDHDGHWCARQVRERYPSVKILTVSMYHDAATVRQALRAGVNGYIPKSAPADELIRAILAVADGRVYLHALVTEALARDVDGTKPEPTAPSLTPRERQILDLVHQGKVVAQIAETLGVSPHTVKVHLASLYRKLQVNDRLNAVLAAVKVGLLPPTLPK